MIDCDVEAFWLGGTEFNGTITNEDNEVGFAQWDKYFNYENPEPNDTQGLAARESQHYGWIQTSFRDSWKISGMRTNKLLDQKTTRPVWIIVLGNHTKALTAKTNEIPRSQ